MSKKNLFRTTSAPASAACWPTQSGRNPRTETEVGAKATRGWRIKSVSTVILFADNREPARVALKQVLEASGFQQGMRARRD